MNPKLQAAIAKAKAEGRLQCMHTDCGRLIGPDDVSSSGSFADGTFYVVCGDCFDRFIAPDLTDIDARVDVVNLEDGTGWSASDN